jgi:hypothetical protein
MKSKSSTRRSARPLASWSDQVIALISLASGYTKRALSSATWRLAPSKSEEAQMKKSGSGGRKRPRLLSTPTPRDNFSWAEVQKMHPLDRLRLNFAQDRVLERKPC